MRPINVTPFIDNESIFGIDLVVEKTKRKTTGQRTLEVIDKIKAMLKGEKNPRGRLIGFFKNFFNTTNSNTI